MSEKFGIQRIAKNIVKTDRNFILFEAPTYRIVFEPNIHTKGVNGVLAIYKKQKSDDTDWKRQVKQKINQLDFGELLGLQLKTETLNNLVETFKHCNTLLDTGAVTESNQKYVLTKESDPASVFIKSISKFNKEDKNGMKKVLGFLETIKTNNKDVFELFASLSSDSHKRDVVDELENRLKNPKEYKECSGHDHWQEWICKNNWLFGGNYTSTISREKINITGSMPDFLFLTADGFADVLEIKTPDNDVICEDKSHSNSWFFFTGCQ